MRRKDREITDAKMIETFIEKEKILRIAFYDGEIYIAPVNYGYSCTNNQYTFYFHGAKAGRKYELSKSEPTVGFEIDGEYKLLESDLACNYSAAFQSVIGTGIVHLLENPEEKKIALDTIMKHLTQKTDWDYKKEMIDATAVFD
ncbi:MAG: pyridoxamine 5'-phosphate oxidase family protein [Lachnospiraceae bacterium]